ncbi:PilZ domain-containing protein [Desulfovulcanus sp.]
MCDQNERRKFMRLPKNYRVEIRELTFPLNQQKWLLLECADISAGGLRISCPQRFSAGQKLQIKIYIPRLNKFHPSFFKVFESDVGQYLEAVAEVAWVKEILPFTRYELGLRFVDVYEDDWQALHNMIKRLV